MRSSLDRYNWHARVFPVYISILPITLALSVTLPQSFKWPLGPVTVFVPLLLAFFAAQIGADPGKRLEKRLWCEWDGPPTTRFLRHSNTEFNRVSREKVHATFRRLGFALPSTNDENEDPKAADIHWEACTEALIVRTRDRTRYPLVYRGLTDYGFRRNLLGLKPLGVSLNFIALLLCLCEGWVSWQSREETDAAVGAAIISFVLLAIWLFWVTKKTVAISADRYARFLLETAQDLE